MPQYGVGPEDCLSSENDPEEGPGHEHVNGQVDVMFGASRDDSTVVGANPEESGRAGPLLATEYRANQPRSEPRVSLR